MFLKGVGGALRDRGGLSLRRRGLLGGLGRPLCVLFGPGLIVLGSGLSRSRAPGRSHRPNRITANGYSADQSETAPEIPEAPDLGNEDAGRLAFI